MELQNQDMVLKVGKKYYPSHHGLKKEKEKKEGRGTVISEEKDILDSTLYFPYCTTILFPLNQSGLGGRPVGQASLVLLHCRRHSETG